MARRTKEEALATRDRILDTAEMLFQQRGVSRTSLHELATAAGVTRGAIYWHFHDKADVFNAMMARVCLPLEESCGAGELGPGDDPLAAIREGLVAMFRRTMSDAQIRRVFEIATHKVEYVEELLAVRDRHLQVRNDYLRQTERGLRLAQRRGRLQAGASPRTLAIGLHALVDGLIQNWMLDPKAFDLVRVGRQTVDTYLAGMNKGCDPPD
jgi:TetR/AcrR family transcriptional regulator, acrAB operon repressor